MNRETLTVLPKGEDFEIIVQHDQTGSAYGITLSKNAYEQLRQHFVMPAFQHSDDMCFHECPYCNCRCNCSNQPCSCCNEA